MSPGALLREAEGGDAGQSSLAKTSGTMSVSTGPYLLLRWNPDIPQCVSSALIPVL